MKLLTNWYSFLALGAMFLWLPNPFLSPISTDTIKVSHSDLQLLSSSFLLNTPEPLTELEKKKAKLLGRKLFFDKSLSLNSQLSCSSCHDPKYDFTDNKPLAVGFGSTEK